MPYGRSALAWRAPFFYTGVTKTGQPARAIIVNRSTPHGNGHIGGRRIGPLGEAEALELEAAQAIGQPQKRVASGHVFFWKD